MISSDGEGNYRYSFVGRLDVGASMFVSHDVTMLPEAFHLAVREAKVLIRRRIMAQVYGGLLRDAQQLLLVATPRFSVRNAEEHQIVLNWERLRDEFLRKISEAMQ